MSLARDLGLKASVGLGVNAVVGSGIFFMPGAVAERLGPASVVAVAIAAVLALLLALCFAEVGSQFRETGGAYLYAWKVLGPFSGFLVGWLSWCSTLVSWSALAVAFASALLDLFPGLTFADAGSALFAPAIAIGLIALVSLVNSRGVAIGGRVSALLAVVKLVPLLLFVGIGLATIDGANLKPFAPRGYDRLGEAVLLIFYGFMGFESLTVPAGEMKDPARTLPRAIVITVSTVCLLYLGIMTVTVAALPDAGHYASPLAAAAQSFGGGAGHRLVGLAAVLSTGGFGFAMALVVPRYLLALADRGQVPAVFGRVHLDRRTPQAAIAFSAVLAGVLASTGSFVTLASVSVLVRLCQYSAVCVVFVRLRRKARAAAPFHLPGGYVAVALCAALLAWMATQVAPSTLAIGLAILALGLPLFVAQQRQSGAHEARSQAPRGHVGQAE